MWKRTISADFRKCGQPVSGKTSIILIIVIFISFLFTASCENKETAAEQQGAIAGESEIPDDDLYLFDYEKIELEKSGSIGLEIGRCNLYADIYEDLIILGEIENISNMSKTDLEITLNFYDRNNQKIISETIKGIAGYLKAGGRMPFYYYLCEKEKYIEIARIQVGINYKDYHKGFKGNPIVGNERHYYTNDGRYLVIEGKLINMGTEKVRNLKLFATFYNERGRVAFIKECYLLRKKMIPGEEQIFTLKLMLDEYLPEFTQYKIEAFYEDEIKA
ncbi:MAG: hypothetical protein U9O59_05725 [Actinomycetota bacterium]|nr:hypothetical protein [Actinomycetota bacterium]